MGGSCTAFSYAEHTRLCVANLCILQQKNAHNIIPFVGICSLSAAAGRLFAAGKEGTRKRKRKKQKTQEESARSPCSERFGEKQGGDGEDE